MNRKNIVLYVSGFYYGGVEEFITNVAANLNNCLYDVCVLTRYADSNSKAYGKLKKKNIMIKSFDIQHLSLKNIRLFAEKLEKYFSQNKVDWIHVNGLDEPLLCYFAQKYKVKICLHTHEPQRELGNRFLNSIKDLLAYNNIRHSDVLMACSTETGKKVFSRYRKFEFEVITNGICVQDFLYDDNIGNMVRRKYGISNERILIGHVGRFTGVKNQSWIIEVFSELYIINKNYCLVLVGHGEDWDYINEKIKKYNLQKNVLLLGECDNVCEILQAIDIFIMPSKYEGLGLALIEAQAAGLKCIISENIPQEALITDLVIEQSLFQTKEEWARTITEIELGYDRKIYSSKVKDSHFDISNTCSQLEKIYAR